ncbi:MAG: LysR family transcriptional regulator [Paracoccaceae bacterium]|nr:LysR family transcriptional regulator [Paracoccaceae bacterium]
MLRAFDSLARTLNLSETADLLGVTRQTVRRHISSLEEVKGGALFGLNKHSYSLTQLGVHSLSGARSMLRQADSWSQGAVTSSNGSQHLEYTQFTDSDGRKFISQQQPVSSVARTGTPVVQRTLAAWAAALTRIEAPEMAEVRPYLVLYRRSAGGWVCVEVGEQSTYAKWFGWTWSKSAVGRLSEDDHAGDDFNRFIAEAYERIHGEGGVRLDHLFAHLPREVSDQPVPVTFQRLLMGCVFPDGTPALALLGAISRNVVIDGLTEEDVRSVSDELIAEFQC